MSEPYKSAHVLLDASWLVLCRTYGTLALTGFIPETTIDRLLSVGLNGTNAHFEACDRALGLVVITPSLAAKVCGLDVELLNIDIGGLDNG